MKHFTVFFSTGVLCSLSVLIIADIKIEEKDLKKM